MITIRGRNFELLGEVFTTEPVHRHLEFYECRDCGAFVSDLNQHATYHEKEDPE